MEEMNEEQMELVNRMLNMLGEKIEDMDKITVHKDGGIVLRTGKLNTEKFIKMAMNY